MVSAVVSEVVGAVVSAVVSEVVGTMLSGVIYTTILNKSVVRNDIKLIATIIPTVTPLAQITKIDMGVQEESVHIVVRG